MILELHSKVCYVQDNMNKKLINESQRPLSLV